MPLSNAVIPIVANVGDAYTFTVNGEDDASGTLVPGPAPADTTPYLAGSVTFVVSDPAALTCVAGSAPNTFDVTVLGASSMASIIFSDGATFQEYEWIVPAPAPTATGLSVSFVKTSGP